MIKWPVFSFDTETEHMICCKDIHFCYCAMYWNMCRTNVHTNVMGEYINVAILCRFTLLGGILTHSGRVTHICVSKLSWSAPSHYLKQCWNIVNWTLRNKLQWNFNRNADIFFHETALESVVCEMAAILSRPQCVNVQCGHYENMYISSLLQLDATNTARRSPYHVLYEGLLWK